MSDNDRARERLDFEAAAEAIEKGESNTRNNLQSSQQVMEFFGGDGRFISSTTIEVITKIAILNCFILSPYFSCVLRC